jgi:hypothetical protein
VTNVLVVSTGELGHPVSLFISVVAGDRSLHGSIVPGVQSEYRSSTEGPTGTRLIRSFPRFIGIVSRSSVLGRSGRDPT